MDGRQRPKNDSLQIPEGLSHPSIYLKFQNRVLVLISAITGQEDTQRTGCQSQGTFPFLLMGNLESALNVQVFAP